MSAICMASVLIGGTMAIPLLGRRPFKEAKDVRLERFL
jgi:hypothetical protein